MIKGLNLSNNYWWVVRGNGGKKIRVVSGYLVGVDISNPKEIIFKVKINEIHRPSLQYAYIYTHPMVFKPKTIEVKDLNEVGVFLTMNEAQKYASDLRRKTRECDIRAALEDILTYSEKVYANDITKKILKLEKRWNSARQQFLTK